MKEMRKLVNQINGNGRFSPPPRPQSQRPGTVKPMEKGCPMWFRKGMESSCLQHGECRRECEEKKVVEAGSYRAHEPL